MSAAAESLRPASYVPHRYASGTFPVSKDYNLRQMLYNHSPSGSRVDDNDINGDLSSQQVIPSFPFSDVPVYADTVDLETLAFHRVWGCLLTPDNVAARIATDDLRYHVWVATKRVIESGRFKISDKEALMTAVMDQFMVELGLVLVDVHKGPLILFVDPRLHNDPRTMVVRAMTMVDKFDQAKVPRWRIIVTLPATTDGIFAARELKLRHGVQTNLSTACIEASANMVNMSVESIMSWFEAESSDIRPGNVSRNHPAIETIQSCVNYIRHHGINTTLLITDVRELDELKQLDGIGSTALTKELLDQMTTQHMVTWHPRLDDASPAMLQVLHGPYPTNYLDSNNFMLSLPAERLSMIFAVLYVELGKMAKHMGMIDQVVRQELEQRIRVETTPLEKLFRRPTNPVTTEERVSQSGSRKSYSTESKRSRSRTRYSTRHEEQGQVSSTPQPRPMIEGVDYF